MYSDPSSALPDPSLRPEFYADTAAKRFFAWLIDVALIFIVSAIVVLFTVFIAAFFYPLLWLVLSFVYRVVTIANGSATLGMRLMSVEFRTHRGERFGLGEAVLHTLVYSISMSTFLIQIASIVLMLTTERKQSLGDMLLGSVALNRSTLPA